MLGELTPDKVLIAGLGVGVLLSWLTGTLAALFPPERVLGRYRDRDGDVPDSVCEPLTGAELAAWEVA